MKISTLLIPLLLFSLGSSQPAAAAPETPPARSSPTRKGDLRHADLMRVVRTVVQEGATTQEEARVLRDALRGFIAEGQRQGHDYSEWLRFDLARPEQRARVYEQIQAAGEQLGSGRPAFYRAAIDSIMTELHETGSKLYSPGEYRKSLEELGFSLGGVGIFIDDTPDAEGLYRIVQVMQGFPSEKQGIQAGDRVLAVNGIKMKGVPFPELAGAVRGPVGTTVELEMQRGTRIQKYTLQREWLRPNPQGATAQMAAPGVGWVWVKYLGLRCNVDILSLWKGLEAQGARSLILDLRNCPGELHGVAPMASLFLPPGSLVYSLEKRGELDKVTTSGAPSIKVPLVVLINDYSSDAAAALAGGLRDTGRAVVVGQPTRPQEMKAYRWLAEELSDGSTISLVTYQVRLPLGQDLAHTPLQPDLVVRVSDPSAEVTGRSDDKAFQRAVKFLQNLK